MPTAFLHDSLGPFVRADPASDLDYSVTVWLKGLIFTAVTWELSPPVTGALHSPSINAAPVIIDGFTYAIGEVATTFVKNLVAGNTYTLTAHATLTGGRLDDRSFRLKCEER